MAYPFEPQPKPVHSAQVQAIIQAIKDKTKIKNNLLEKEAVPVLI